jgi:hypothetical protein
MCVYAYAEYISQVYAHIPRRHALNKPADRITEQEEGEEQEEEEEEINECNALLPLADPHSTRGVCACV